MQSYGTWYTENLFLSQIFLSIREDQMGMCYPRSPSTPSQEVKNMSRKLRQLKSQMFLKQVEVEEPPSSVDFFRSFRLAVEQDFKEVFQSRSISLSDEGTSSRSSSFDDSMSFINASFSSIGDIHRSEERRHQND